VDTAHGELEAGPGGPGLGLRSGLTGSLSTSRHVVAVGLSVN